MLTDFYAKTFGTFEYKKHVVYFSADVFFLMKGGDNTMAAKKKVAKKKVAKKKVVAKKKKK